MEKSNKVLLQRLCNNRSNMTEYKINEIVKLTTNLNSVYGKRKYKIGKIKNIKYNEMGYNYLIHEYYWNKKEIKKATQKEIEKYKLQQIVKNL